MSLKSNYILKIQSPLKSFISFLIVLSGSSLFAQSFTETNVFSLNTATWEVSAPNLSGGTVTGVGFFPLDPIEMTVLEAVPRSGYVFIGWTGDATGFDNPLSLLIDTDKTIGADFISTTHLARIQQEARSVVLADPSSYNLISADLIPSALSLGGIRISGSGQNMDISFTIETSTDLDGWIVEETINRQLQLHASGPIFIRVGVPD